MRPRLYAIVQRAIEEGVARGYTRAHKHTDAPERGELLDTQVDAVLECLGEVLAWDPEDYE